MNTVLCRLKEEGCNIDQGLESCCGNEDRYLRRLRRFAESRYLDKQEEAYRSHNIERCRMYAHTMNAEYCNLGLDALYYLNSCILEMRGAAQLPELGEVLSCLRDKYNKYVSIIKSPT
ncbi:MAG: hypothetical protein J6K00_08660 [Oscillospiraceae bacterium]|nr:hypothetical protein [Oscillospiraceae bacterium]